MRATRIALGLAVAVAGVLVGAGTLAALHGRGGMSGEYDEVGGPGRLEFKGSRVYVGAALGMTYVAAYEVDGDRVIVRGGGGAQVYTRHGDTLEAGLGVKFVKKARPTAAAEE